MPHDRAGLITVLCANLARPCFCRGIWPVFLSICLAAIQPRASTAGNTQTIGKDYTRVLFVPHDPVQLSGSGKTIYSIRQHPRIWYLSCSSDFVRAPRVGFRDERCNGVADKILRSTRKRSAARSYLYCGIPSNPSSPRLILNPHCLGTTHLSRCPLGSAHKLVR
jgi:hypothetical protein